MPSALPTYKHRFDRVEGYLHHRQPYLMVDRVVTITPAEVRTELEAPKTGAYVEGHFPGAAIFPGAMLQEFTTQSAGILIAAEHNPMAEFSTEDPFFNPYALGVLVGVSEARYKGFARPGDQLQAVVKLLERMGNRFEFSASVSREGERIMRIRFHLANIESRLLQGDG